MNFFKSVLAVLFVFAFFLLYTSCSKSNEEQKTNQNDAASQEVSNAKVKVFPLVSTGMAQGSKAADFTWRQDGKDVKFSDYTKNKYVLLNFWGTWCPPCRREIPDIIEIAKEMESKGLIVIGAALERANTVQEALMVVSDYWKVKEMYYPVILASQELAEAYGGIEAVPTTYLINKKGEVFEVLQGYRNKSDFMTSINRMMKAE